MPIIMPGKDFSDNVDSPPSSSLSVWDADDTSELTLSSGDVTNWSDEKSTNDLSNVISTSPTYESNVLNGLGGVFFDNGGRFGNNEDLETGTISLTDNGKVSIYSVVTPVNSSAGYQNGPFWSFGQSGKPNSSVWFGPTVRQNNGNDE